MLSHMQHVLQQRVTSVLKCFLSVAKREEDVAQRQTCHCHYFLECVAHIKFRMRVYLQKPSLVKFTRLNIKYLIYYYLHCLDFSSPLFLESRSYVLSQISWFFLYLTINKLLFENLLQFESSDQHPKFIHSYSILPL